MFSQDIAFWTSLQTKRAKTTNETLIVQNHTCMYQIMFKLKKLYATKSVYMYSKLQIGKSIDIHLYLYASLSGKSPACAMKEYLFYT
jgi:hypothetical protein